jgi:hypothetical protein
MVILNLCLALLLPVLVVCFNYYLLTYFYECLLHEEDITTFIFLMLCFIWYTFISIITFIASIKLGLINYFKN